MKSSPFFKNEYLHMQVFVKNMTEQFYEINITLLHIL
jgi:hypothetical protein